MSERPTTLNLGAAHQRAAQEHPAPPSDLDPQGHLSSIPRIRAPGRSLKSLFAFYQDSRNLDDCKSPGRKSAASSPPTSNLIKGRSIFGAGPTILNKLRSGLEHLETAAPTPHPHRLLPHRRPGLNAIFACDLLLIPISTDYLSLQAADQITCTLQVPEPVLKRRVERRYLLTRFDRRRRMSDDVRNNCGSGMGMKS